MRLCLVTVTHNSEGVLPDFLRSLPFARSEVDHLEVVAVDNDSTDGTLDVLYSSDVPVEVVRNAGNDGYAAGINRAIEQHPEADAYLVLNPDARLRIGSVGALCRELDDPRIGVVVPNMVRPDGSRRYSLRRDPSVLRVWAELVLTGERAARIGALGERIGSEEAYRGSHVVDWASGSAMLISRQCSQSVGPWDETFFLYSEETDFCLRARAAGFVTYYCASSTIEHLGGASRISEELHALLTLNRVRCFRKHHGPLETVVFSLAILLKQFVRQLRGDELGRSAVRSLLFPSARHPELLRILTSRS